MCDDYHFVAAINELRGDLVDVTFDSSWLGKEEVANHGNIVRHYGAQLLSTSCCVKAEAKEAIIAVVEMYGACVIWTRLRFWF